MEPSLLPDPITYDDFTLKLKAYDSTVTSNLKDLDRFRVSELPQTLKQRQDAGAAFLDKSEATKLLDWKLKHGTYRPTLPALLASNPPALIKSTTTEAFSLYNANPSDPIKPINTLAKLKGIGPATASLLLSVFDHENVPFFSDELFRWLHFEEPAGKGGGKGWERKIGYTMKEYKGLLEKMGGLRERLRGESGEGGEEWEGPSALDVEMVASVIFAERGEPKVKRKRGADEVDRKEEGKEVEESDLKRSKRTRKAKKSR